MRVDLVTGRDERTAELNGAEFGLEPLRLDPKDVSLRVSAWMLPASENTANPDAIRAPVRPGRTPLKVSDRNSRVRTTPE